MFFRKIPIWGHRGWPTRFPDNVLAGITAAAEVASGVEVDVRRSADGALVLSHDPDLAGLVVADHTWRELSSLDLGGGHPPVRLTDLADIGVPLDIEVKNLPWQPGYEDDHRIALDAAGWARPGDIVTSFWWPSVDAVRAVSPDVPTGLLFDRQVAWSDALHRAVDGGHRAIVPHRDLVDARVAGAARDEGIEVVAWTVDDPDEAARLADLGIAAIISNRPGELIAVSPPPEQFP